MEYRPYYRRHLPHYQPAGYTLFLTFRLAGSLPAAVIDRLRAEAEAEERRLQGVADPAARARRRYDARKRAFGRFDATLDQAPGPRWLGVPAVAQAVADALHHRHPAVYRLDAFCIMPNHVHAVFAPNDDEAGRPLPLPKIMQSLKQYAAGQANAALGRQGQFWQYENYDHVVRDAAEWERIIWYVLLNPVKAGLVEHWEDWPWTYLRA